MSSAMSLSHIVALARAGALDHAWQAFRTAGYDRRDGDPVALTVKGRLLKDFALRAKTDQDRRRFFQQSAEQYQKSAAIQPATYPLINAATLSLLSGDLARARKIAGEVLDRIRGEPDEPETPYWHAATEAEALLLLDRSGEAEAAIETALAAAPQAWEDHASTLRQFLAIEHALGANYRWLSKLRAKPSVHFATDKPGRVGDIESIARHLDQTVGFGFGSLAAGAELCAAEALIRQGAQLNIIVASDADSFAARFVDPHGGDWRSRFDAALAAADSVRNVRPIGAPPTDAAVALTNCIAWGAALLNAEELMGDAAQLGTGPAVEVDGLALVALRLADGGPLALEERLSDVRAAFDTLDAPAVSPHLNGELVLAGYADVDIAAHAARGLYDALQNRFPIQLAAHYGLIDSVCDPFSGSVRPTGSGVAIVQAIAGAAPPSTICVSDDFACVLTANTRKPRQVSRIGEIQALDGGTAIGLYALNRAPS